MSDRPTATWGLEGGPSFSSLGMLREGIFDTWKRVSLSVFRQGRHSSALSSKLGHWSALVKPEVGSQRPDFVPRTTEKSSTPNVRQHQSGTTPLFGMCQEDFVWPMTAIPGFGIELVPCRQLSTVDNSQARGPSGICKPPSGNGLGRSHG